MVLEVFFEENKKVNTKLNGHIIQPDQPGGVEAMNPHRNLSAFSLLR